MKAHTTTISIALASFITGSMAISSSAYASLLPVPKTLTNHSGTICKNYNAADASKIDYLSSGVFSKHHSPTQIICPLIRRTTNGTGAIVYVDIEHKSHQTTSCTVYSRNRKGHLLASETKKWTGNGFKELRIDLSGFNKSDKWSDYSVLCKIPGNSNGKVMGIDLEENPVSLF